MSSGAIEYADYNNNKNHQGKVSSQWYIGTVVRRHLLIIKLSSIIIIIIIIIIAQKLIQKVSEDRVLYLLLFRAIFN